MLKSKTVAYYTLRWAQPGEREFYEKKNLQKDFLQECQLAILECNGDFIATLKNSSKRFRSLLKAFGYSRKKGEVLEAFFYNKKGTFTPEEEQLLWKIEEYYATHTAKETAAEFGIPEKAAPKLLHNFMPKQAGWGGARKGGRQKENSYILIFNLT